MTRKQTYVRLTEKDLENLEKIKDACDCMTRNESVRQALRIAAATAQEGEKD